MLFARHFLSDQQILRSNTSQNPPLVSVILPTYRRCKSGMLERAISSVLNQEMRDFELIVMDDGSTDGSNELIERYRANDDRVVHVRHDQNCGLPALRVNEGIEIARGKYIAFQFDDDVWRPTALGDLTRGAQKLTERSVIVGRALFHMEADPVLPIVEVNNITMHQQNRIANNSVLIPRELFYSHGMYDTHIAMRRLCDWDLWLRMIRDVPFVVIDEIVADIFVNNDGSIALTVPFDTSLFRFVNSIQRNHLLTPDNWKEYPLDALEINGVSFSSELAMKLYDEQIVHFYMRNRHRLPHLENFPTTFVPTRRKTILYTKGSYEVSNEIIMNNFDPLTNRRGSYKSYFHHLKDLLPSWVDEADMIMLMRTVEDNVRPLLDLALIAGKPVTYCMDDDLLTFHEFGPQFNYLAPGTPMYKNLTHYLKNVDSVIVTNEVIGESAREYNPRIVLDNGSVPAEYLPDMICPRSGDRPLRIGYVGSGYRIDEFKALWPAFQRLSDEYGDRLEFEFWGLDVSSLPKLASPVTQQPFTFSYFHYLKRLNESGFDIVLVPMLDHPRPRLGKARIKYYETAISGGLGIFSDVPQYRKLADGVTCLKTANTPDAWYKTMKQAVEMDPQEFDRMRARCLEDVREKFTVEGQINNHEAALRAAEFHGKTRHLRHEDGKPRVLYFFHSAYIAGAEIQLWRRLRIARSYGIEPVAVMPLALRNTPQGNKMMQSLEEEGIQLEFVESTFFTEPISPAEFHRENELIAFRALIDKVRPALVHSVTFVPSLGQVCAEQKIPHIATLYQVDEKFAWPAGHQPFHHCSLVQSDSLLYAMRWSDLLGVPRFVSRNNVPKDILAIGERRLRFLMEQPDQAQQQWNCPQVAVMGTFQERKRQLETIEALGKLKQQGYNFHVSFYGYTEFFSSYVDQCRKRIAFYNMEGMVDIHDFTDNVQAVLEQTDIVLSLSSYESFPNSISEGIASGIVPVATPVGGIPELLINGQVGILCSGLEEEDLIDGIRRAFDLSLEDRQRIAVNGRKLARAEFHPFRTSNDLFQMYNLVLESEQVQQDGAQQASAVRVLPQSVSNTSSTLMLSAPPSSSLKLGAGLRYRFTPHRTGWNGVDIMVGLNLTDASGLMILKVKTEDGIELRRSEVNLAGTRDNDWVAFRFDPIYNTLAQTFVLEFQLRNSASVLSIYQASGPQGRHWKAVRWLGRKIGLMQPGGILYCRDWYRYVVEEKRRNAS